MTPAEYHLTQEEFDELLMGVADPELQAHCVACVPCGARVAALSKSFELYNHASLAWAEARSNTFTRDLSGHRPTRRVTASAARSVAATLILGLVAGLSTGTHRWPASFTGSALQAAPAARAFAPDARAQQIARDNAMLEAINTELREPDAAPASLLHVTDGVAARPASAQDRD